MGRSFANFEDQVDYNDVEHFLRDCTTPFRSVVENSETYDTFKIRLENVENFYLYSRKQNQIGIETALNLCEEEVTEAKNNGFETSFDKEVLEACFNKYSDKLVSLGNSDISDILENLKKEIQNVDKLPLEQWTPNFKQNMLPVFLAYLSSVWTKRESKDVAVINRKIQPHCVQILCIFRLLGVDHHKNGVPKHFAQVLTGQGKSVILGLLSSLIAMTGNRCDIVCYSNYLATRDQNAYKTFFEIFSDFFDESHINYITFDNMAANFLKRKINGLDVDLRCVVDKIVLNQPCADTIESIEEPKDTVLAIDEADVFFTDKMYGQTSNFGSTVGMRALIDIQPKLWETVKDGVRNKSVIFDKIREFITELLKKETYKDFEKFLSSTNDLFEKHLEQMIDAALHVSKMEESNDSEIQLYKINYEGLICMKDKFDGYSPNIFRGYYTIFNYFRLKKNNYDDKGFRNYGYIVIRCGKISYSNLPTVFKNILGVSGTLMTLNNSEIDAIKGYGIQTISAMPSFFGKRKLKFNPCEDVSFHDTVESWHSRIYDRISNSVQNGRAILVFFETDKEVRIFEEKYRNHIDRLFALIGDEEPSTLEWRIAEAGVAQTVTLATKSMGRGIDYKSNDKSVEEKGGIHVIQTFFSLDIKEETQIKGRTARQNNEGSYEMILCREDLKKKNCSTSSDGRSVESYSVLSIIRQRLAIERGKATEARIKKSEEIHNKTIEFLDSLTKYNPEDRLKYLSRYPFAMDE